MGATLIATATLSDPGGNYVGPPVLIPGGPAALGITFERLESRPVYVDVLTGFLVPGREELDVRFRYGPLGRADLRLTAAGRRLMVLRRDGRIWAGIPDGWSPDSHTFFTPPGFERAADAGSGDTLELWAAAQGRIPPPGLNPRIRLADEDEWPPYARLIPDGMRIRTDRTVDRTEFAGAMGEPKQVGGRYPHAMDRMDCDALLASQIDLAAFRVWERDHQNDWFYAPWPWTGILHRARFRRAPEYRFSPGRDGTGTWTARIALEYCPWDDLGVVGLRAESALAAQRDFGYGW